MSTTSSPAFETLAPGAETSGSRFTAKSDYLPAMPLVDEPSAPYGWRGLLIDICRHWISPESLHRTIDAMAMAQLNVLHLHLSEDQAFRLESRRWPRLHRVGSGGNYLTHDDVRRLVEHATEQGIRIVPELDMPGHTTSWLVAYPHLAATDGPFELRTNLGIGTVALDPDRESTFEFIDGLLNELVELFPDAYLHIGGDEVDAKAWPGRSVATTQAAFTDRVAAMVFDTGRTPVVWDEAWHAGLDPRVVVQVWRGHGRLRAAAAEGRPVLLSTPYYLDLAHHPEHHVVNPASSAQEWAECRAKLFDDPTLGVWAQLAMGMEGVWEVGVPDPPDQFARGPNLLGGEACLWTELCPEELLDLRLWPSTVAVADTLVDPAPAAKRSAAEWSERFAAFEDSLLAIGIDLGAQRRARWLTLAGGDEAFADDLATMARCCEPTKWYSRHAALADGRLDQPFDRFVDALGSEAPGTAADPEVRAAAGRLLERIEPATADPRWIDVRDVASIVARDLDDLAPIETAGEVLVITRRSHD